MKLIKCPKCKSDAKVDTKLLPYPLEGDIYGVVCQVCGYFGKHSTSEDEAIKNWNEGK